MLARFLSFIAIGSILWGCSSDPKPIPSGGALLELIRATSLPNTTCADVTGRLVLAAPGDGGTTGFTQFNDGVDGAKVACSLQGTKYSLQIMHAGVQFLASGTASGDVSNDASVIVVTPLGNAYSSSASSPCVIKFQKRDGGKIEGYVSCAAVIGDNSASMACALPERTGTFSNYFGFANCQM